MRSVFVGLCVCVCVAFAAPAFGEAQGMGEEKAAEQAKEAVEKQTPAVKAGPPAEMEKRGCGREGKGEAGRIGSGAREKKLRMRLSGACRVQMEDGAEEVAALRPARFRAGRRHSAFCSPTTTSLLRPFFLAR